MKAFIITALVASWFLGCNGAGGASKDEDRDESTGEENVGSTDADSDADGDADTDVDTDSDADTDVDTDSDADTDVDTDSDADTDADADGSCGQPVADALETSAGCAGVFNPDQILDLRITMDEGDWAALRAETSAEGFNYYPAELVCGGEAPMLVGVRKKRSGGNIKVGLKVDINELVDDQTFYGLKKLSLENGVSEGDTEDGAEIRAYVSEYLAWRLMQLSRTISSRAVFARVFMNGAPLGVYINVEQVDKRFLANRLGDDAGWLYKKSGGIEDGWKTHETDGLMDPYSDYFCFFERNGCAAPSADALAAELPSRLDIPQLLRMGALNALMGNTDSPLLKDNNFYFYDSDCHPRIYLPWDLDTVMSATYDVFDGSVPGGVDTFTSVLFPNWESDYADILKELLSGALTLEAIEAELDRAAAVAGAALDEDPYVSGETDDAVNGGNGLKAWWSSRHSTVKAIVDAH